VSRGIPANVGFLCDKAAVLRDTIKETGVFSVIGVETPQFSDFYRNFNGSFGSARLKWLK